MVLKKTKNAKLLAFWCSQSGIFMFFFFILLIAGQNHATLKCKNGLTHVFCCVAHIYKYISFYTTSSKWEVNYHYKNHFIISFYINLFTIKKYIWSRQPKTWVSPFLHFKVVWFRPAIKNIKKNPINSRLWPSES